MFKSHVIYQKNTKDLFNKLNIIVPKLVINSYVNTPQLLIDIFYNKLNVINKIMYLVIEENNLHLIVIKKYNSNIIVRKINNIINIRIKFESNK